MAQSFGRLAEVVAYNSLPPNPVKITLDPADKIDLRLVPSSSDAGDVAR